MFVSRCSSEKSDTGVSVCRMDTYKGTVHLDE